MAKHPAEVQAPWTMSAEPVKALRALERVWIAKIEGQMELGAGVHQIRRHRVEAFRCLPVTLALLRSELTGPAAIG